MPKLKAVSEPGRYGDGDGLYLTVSPRGSKSWVQRIMIDGRRRDIGLGGFPTVSLAQARLRAADNRQAVAEGRDPLLEKRRAAMPTFREAARTVHEANKPRWRNARHTASWLRSLETYAMPILGGIPLDRIQQSDVLRSGQLDPRRPAVSVRGFAPCCAGAWPMDTSTETSPARSSTAHCPPCPRSRITCGRCPIKKSPRH